MFYKIEITGDERENEKEEPFFITDRMLGKLTTWLRILGYDTVYASNIEDKDIVSLAKREKRILLTRDEELLIFAKRQGVRYVPIKAEKVSEQIKELLRYNINLNLYPTMSRCGECNTRIRKVKEEEENLLHDIDYVPKNKIGSVKFWICEGCGRIYWKGSHWRDIMNRLKNLKSFQDMQCL